MKFHELYNIMKEKLPVSQMERFIMTGVIKNYRVVMKQQEQDDCTLTFSFKPGDVLPAEDLQYFIDSLKKNSKNINKVNLQYFKLEFTIRFKKNVDETAKMLLDIIEDMASYLSRNHYVSCCEHCGKDRNLQPYECKERAMILCDSCYQDLHAKTETLMQQLQKRKGSILLGLLGAFIGSLLGMGIWFLCSYYQMMIGLAGIALAFFTIKGYQLCYGKINKVAFSCLLIWMSICITVIQYICFIRDIYQTLHEEFFITLFEAMNSVPVFLQEKEVIWNLISDTAIGFIMMAITAFFMMKHLLKGKRMTLNLLPIEESTKLT